MNTVTSDCGYLLGYVISFDKFEPYKLEASPASVGAFILKYGIINNVTICFPDGRQLLRTRGYLISRTIDWDFCKDVMIEISKFLNRK